MLKTLYISNYALIDRLEVNFASGLTIITGETGAGKSIIMGALALILGERASSQAIRDRDAKTVVEATFDVSGFNLRPMFEDADVDYADECLLRRELSASGRSRAFVNDTPVPLNTLKEIATRLVDLHSQHSNMLLASPAFQLDILDAIAHCDTEREEYARHYRAMRAATAELDALQQQLAEARTEQDYLRFQLDQLDQMQLQPGEDVTLETQQKRLANATTIKEQLWNVLNTLDGEQGALLHDLRGITTQLTALEPLLAETAGMADRAEATLIELKDIAATLAALQDTLDDDPDELQRVEARLGDIYSLERKHNVASVDELLAVQEGYRQRLDAITTGDERLEQQRRRVEELTAIARQHADTLSQQRAKAANSLEQQLVQRAVTLGLKNVNFTAQLTPVALGATGADAVEFMMAFNKNQSPMPVRDTASGGEISRVMLCIKAIVAHSMNLPTIIFDEVDTGVSGDTATRIGEMMTDIASTIQVIAITHLPQVAALGNNHLKVYKTDSTDATLTSVQTLDADEHVLEVARMLSGRQLDKAAIDNAKSLIAQHRR